MTDTSRDATDSGFNQEALDRASWELQRHFGREGSIYGFKACEEIARIALTAYGARSATAGRSEITKPVAYCGSRINAAGGIDRQSVAFDEHTLEVLGYDSSEINPLYFKNAAPQVREPAEGERPAPAVAAPIDKASAEPDGYAVLLDDPKGETPGQCGYWYVGAYRTKVVAKSVAERNKGARVVPMFFKPPSATLPPVPSERIEEKYYELLYAVARAFPGETRHQTALRYIQQAERASNDSVAAASTRNEK